MQTLRKCVTHRLIIPKQRNSFFMVEFWGGKKFTAECESLGKRSNHKVIGKQKEQGCYTCRKQRMIFAVSPPPGRTMNRLGVRAARGARTTSGKNVQQRIGSLSTHSTNTATESLLHQSLQHILNSRERTIDSIRIERLNRTWILREAHQGTRSTVLFFFFLGRGGGG